MKKIKKFALSLIAAFGLLAIVVAQENVPWLIPVMQKELTRNLEGLHMEGLQRPFFISQRIHDLKRLTVQATCGGLINANLSSLRSSVPFMLVGDYNKNNSNFNTWSPFVLIDVENDAKGVATAMWTYLDPVYKNAAEQYNRKQAIIAQQERDEAEKNIPDWENTAPTVLHLPPQKANLDQKYWSDYARQASAIVEKYPEIIDSYVSITAAEIMTYICNTEGTQISMPQNSYNIFMQVETQTSDGQRMSDKFEVSSSTFERMPSLEKFKEQAEAFIKNFISLRNAPLIEDVYVGPVMFEGSALATYFKSVFQGNNNNGPLIARRPPVNANQINRIEMLKDKKLISRSLTIKDLSGSPTYKGQQLEGYFPIDATGVAPAKELTLVENGVLRDQLTGRIPTPKFQHSNGHWRICADWFLENPVMPGVLQMTSNNTLSPDALKQKLLAAAKEEDLDYAYIIRRAGNSVYAYRIFTADGHEELVRGAQLAGVELKEFKRILGVSDKEQIANAYSWNTICTYILPEALIFQELEVTKTNQTFRKPIVVERPKVQSISKTNIQ